MKKAIVSILAFIYLSVSSGIAMEIHYCMGKKAGVEFFGGKDSKCGKCGMKEKKGGCCNDEHKFYKLQDSHKNVSNSISFEMPAGGIITSYPVFDWQAPADDASFSINNHSPPDDNRPSVCIMNCVFRI